MIKYKKSLPYVCVMLLALGCFGCKAEARQDAVQTCALDQKAKTTIESEKPVTRVVFDDKALAALTKQKVTVIYCIAMGAS